MNRKKLIEIVKLTIAARAAGQRVSRIDRQLRKQIHHAACDAVRPCPACVSWHRNNDTSRALERRNLRDLYLAYAYLRGVPYSHVERKCRTAPNTWDVGRTIWSLLDAKVPQQPLDTDVKRWLAGASPVWPVDQEIERLVSTFLVRHPKLRVPHRWVDEDGAACFEWWRGAQGAEDSRRFSIIVDSNPTESEWIHTFHKGQEYGPLDESLDVAAGRFLAAEVQEERAA
jgi:hypothetical protein